MTEYSTMNAALSGTTLITGGDHDALAHLSYATAGHTGFQPTITTGTTAQYFKGDLSLGAQSQFEPAITAGTSAQYLKGDKSLGNQGQFEPAISTGTIHQVWRGDKSWGSLPWVNAVEYSTIANPVDPTGAVDSSAGIQAAIDSLSAGGTVYIPAGTYLINSGLVYNTEAINAPGVVIRGSGMRSTVINNQVASGYAITMKGHTTAGTPADLYFQLGSGVMDLSRTEPGRV